MQIRKWTVAALAVVLVASVASTALAAKTVAAEVYGDSQAASSDLNHGEVVSGMIHAGIEDVDTQAPYAGSVLVVVQAGLLMPDANGNFRPNASAATNETVAAFAKVLGIANPTDTPDQALAKAIAAGLTTAQETSGPVVTRMMVARLIARALDVKADYSLTYPYTDGFLLSADDQALVATLTQLGVFKGYPDGSFGPLDTLTRFQLAILLDRVMGAFN